MSKCALDCKAETKDGCERCPTLRECEEECETCKLRCLWRLAPSRKKKAEGV